MNHPDREEAPMSRTRRRRPVAWGLAVVAAFAVGVLTSWMLWSASNHGRGEGNGHATGGDQSFAITGDLTAPVSPGIAVPLDLRIVNTREDALLVTELTVTIRSVDAPNATESRPCDPRDFVVEQIPAAAILRVDPKTSSTLTQLGLAHEDWPRIGMVAAATNQDGCKGASLDLGYTAIGRFPA
jgi:hypothetical protein